MCDDIAASVAQLQAKGAEITGPVEDRGYGLATGVRLPSGATIGLYEPRHASPLDL
jgi:predicted enzyme related to lactoylglutathione lyase